jgi:hypothetical protein
MTEIKKSAKPKAASKKKVKSEIEKKLEIVFADFKTELGEKKFNHRIKKASKILLHGLKKKAENKIVEIKKQEVKTAPKKVAKKVKKVAAK